MRAPRSRPTTIKEAAYNCMEKAYTKASAGGALPANARMVMYAARPFLLADAGECWSSSSYFTQHLPPDFMEEHCRGDWNVVFDARGHLAPTWSP